jgi:hypothetical protein
VVVVNMRGSFELFAADGTPIILFLHLRVMLRLRDTMSAITNATIHFFFVGFKIRCVLSQAFLSVVIVKSFVLLR